MCHARYFRLLTISIYNKEHGKPSEWFIVDRGVHQGDPLSMRLYQVFINALIGLLKTSGHGLHLGPINVSCPASADDLAVLSIQKPGLNIMLKIAYEYSVKWWFDWSFSKSKGLIWGKDEFPNTQITFGPTPLDTVNKYKHLGIMQHNNKVPTSVVMTERICKGRSTLLAARGIGSIQVPMNPAVLNRIYWSVCIPQMLYGIEVVPLSDGDMSDLEKAHRQNSKTIQSLPPSVPNPAVYSTLGWLSMEAYIAQVKIIFLWKIAMCLRDTIYFRAIRFIIELIISGSYKSKTSPIRDTLMRASKLGIMSKVVDCVFSIDCEHNFLAEKSKIKKLIFDLEISRWRATCMMYSSLRLYRKSTNDISLNCWWYYVKTKPNMSRRVSSVIAVLVGSQPSGLQRNHGASSCGLCGCQEDASHVIFDCIKLSDKRRQLWSQVESTMPQGLRNDINDMTSIEKSIILLSGFGNKFIREWSELYKNAAIFIHEMYVTRSECYDALLDTDSDIT